MDLCDDTLNRVVLPTAFFKSWDEPANIGDGKYDTNKRTEAKGLEIPWSDSRLNPKNRIDSLELLPNPLWRIDGCASQGRLFLIAPLFLGPVPPLRIGAVIDSTPSYPQELRDVLDLDRIFHTRDAVRVNRLGIARYVLRILQFHTAPGLGISPQLLEKHYKVGKFYTRLNMHLSFNIRTARVHLSPAPEVDQALLSYKELKRLWEESKVGEMPARLPIDSFVSIKQLTESTAVVCHREGGVLPDGSKELLILKSVVEGRVKYLYHELRELLRMPPHPNIISRPIHLVTKPCGFGGKIGVVGFTIPYYPLGSIRDLLPVLRIHEQLRMEHQLRWAKQITEALNHVLKVGKTYYSDLRLDNLLLTDSYDIILVDFEQRGVWFGFSAPEVTARETLLTLENWAIEHTDDDNWRDEIQTTSSIRNVLGWVNPNLRDRIRDATRIVYDNPRLGYCEGWSTLRPGEWEPAMVYMLGRVLWCIFEGMSAPDQRAIWQSYAREPEIAWPAYRRTPTSIRLLVECCRSVDADIPFGAFERRGNKIEPKSWVAGVINKPLAPNSKPNFTHSELAEFTVRGFGSCIWSVCMHKTLLYCRDAYIEGSDGKKLMGRLRPTLDQVLNRLEREEQERLGFKPKPNQTGVPGQLEPASSEHEKGSDEVTVEDAPPEGTQAHDSQLGARNDSESVPDRPVACCEPVDESGREVNAGNA